MAALLGLSCVFGFLKSIGDTFVYLFGVVIVTKLFQALVLRLLADLPWTSGALGMLETFVLVVGGLVFALLILPKEMLAHANDAASVALGTSAVKPAESGRIRRQSRRAVGHEVHEKYQDYRSDDSSWEQSKNSTFSTGSSANDETVNYRLGEQRAERRRRYRRSRRPRRAGTR